MTIALWILVVLSIVQIAALAHLSAQLADFYRIVSEAIDERKSDVN
jgi:hypothetical protein